LSERSARRYFQQLIPWKGCTIGN
nr:hypothetical protein [Tanacetum cinerariifolium]